LKKPTLPHVQLLFGKVVKRYQTSNTVRFCSVLFCSVVLEWAGGIIFHVFIPWLYVAFLSLEY